MTPKSWYQDTIGKTIDTDNYPRNNPFQCWDYFDYFCRVIGFTGSRYCASTGYVGDMWLLRDAEGYNYSTAFDYITDPIEFKTGDWFFTKTHVAMYYEGMELGQNQPAPYVTLKSMNWDGVLGAMRWKRWEVSDLAYGYSKLSVNGRAYTLWRMGGADKIAVLSPGLNKTATIKQMDADVLVESKILGANYFQMREDIPDQPYGMTFGDISSPLCGVYQTLPNQDSTLFYDLETGLFGDCTDVTIDSSHNVFSPSLVYPNSKGNWEYARMVDLSHKDLKSWYTFMLRFTDGTYALGIAGQESTPQEIADDLVTDGVSNIAFLDGGGSAQAAFWHDGSMDYVRDTGRACASALAVYRMPEDPIIVPEIPEEEPEVPDIEPEEPLIPEEPEEDEEEEDIMPEKDKDWTDPEPTVGTTIAQRISSLLSVKSIVTLALTAAFIYLVINEKTLPEDFTRIYLMAISFFFGYQFEKGGNKK